MTMSLLRQTVQSPEETRRLGEVEWPQWRHVAKSGVMGNSVPGRSREKWIGVRRGGVCGACSGACRST